MHSVKWMPATKDIIGITNIEKTRINPLLLGLNPPKSNTKKYTPLIQKDRFIIDAAIQT